jgi:hypothetical protein
LDEGAAHDLNAALTRALATRQIATRQADLFAQAKEEAGQEIIATSPKVALRCALVDARSNIDRACDWPGREGGHAAIVGATLRASAHALTAAQIAQNEITEKDQLP